MNLTDKVALVTGSARGIGREIALNLAQKGAALLLTDIDEAGIQQLAEEISSLGYKALAVKADVSKTPDVENLVSQGMAHFGKIDVLVNNAGITRDNLIIRMKDEEWDQVLEVNLKSAFLLSRAVGKVMLKQKSGKIINISSVVGLMGNPGQVNYAASKAGLIGLTKSLARELASRGITVNAIAPGFIKTIMTEKLSQEARERLASAIPLGILGESWDVAQTVIFLASDSARYITGQVINVDGGMVMN